MRTKGCSMSDLLADLNRDLTRETVTDAIGVVAICVTMLTILWLPGLLAG